ncbi:MAG: hypothetical protein HY880_07235 [Deltaproteobacteria bacterium]|nr:hypothetical protein [Deltaproteobacteria bacterium]
MGRWSAGFIAENYILSLGVFFFVVFIINLPFGYLRKRHKKLTKPWARCIYIPILLNYILRKSAGLSYGFKLLPVVIVVVVAGQLLGAAFSKRPDQCQ